MPLEIERKFLVKDMSWKQGQDGVFYKQGYFPCSCGPTVRIRIAGDKGFITVKTKSNKKGDARSEYEYSIPLEEAREMLESICEQPCIEKVRYIRDYHGIKWEVDEFLGENFGLVMAEVELESTTQQIQLPPWAGKEVTGDKRFYNAFLAKNPYTKW
jgi:CYTH domain-containing protein